MLSVSIEEAGEEIIIDGLTNPECKKIVGIPHSEVLIGYADAFMSRDANALVVAREALVDEMGAAAMVDVVGIASNFQRMVRIADSTAIPLATVGRPELSEEVNKKLGLNDTISAANANEI